MAGDAQMGRITSQNYESARVGIQFMREGVEATTQHVGLAISQIMILGQTGMMSGPAYDSFSQVATEWERLMKLEIDRLADFADTGEDIVNRQEQAEIERARKELGEPGWSGPVSRTGYAPDAGASGVRPG